MKDQASRHFRQTTFTLRLSHAIFWLVYIASEIGYVAAHNAPLDPWFTYLSYYTINLGFFYGVLSALNAAGWLSMTGRLILLTCLFLAARFLAAHELAHTAVSFSQQWHRLGFFLTEALFRGFYFGLMAFLYWLAGRQAANASKLAEARAAYLHQQINPHLLFNALNLIYTSVYRHSASGARPVYLLAEIMRYSLAEPAGDGRVPLQLEIEQIRHLIEINASRFAEPLQLETDLPAADSSARILPLILLTFTENIFKHGNLLMENKPARLQISQTENDRLTFFSRNLKKNLAGTTRLQSLGLANARTRLELYYQKNYTLTIRDTAEWFELTLTLPL